jgi:acetylornithine deacetylase/succinyl-diaminopimelate desuccinylase-like protein
MIMDSKRIGRRVGRLPVACCLLLLFAPGSVRPDSSSNPQAQSLGRERMGSVLRELADFMAIPNVASDPVNIRRNAEHLARMMRKRGIETRILETAGGPPVVSGEIKTPGAKQTLLVYAHYDGQPVDPAAWTSDPWKPVLMTGTIAGGGRIVRLAELRGEGEGEWRLYGRGASDDKGTIVAALAALDVLKERGKALSVNVKYLFEGEEEQGSPHLEAFLRGQTAFFKADGMILCDGPVHQTRRPQIVFGARGSLGLEMTVFGPDRALHSGHYGNWAPNPAAVLSHILASLRSKDGTINIPGFYDDVRPLSESERKAVEAAPAVDGELLREFGLGYPETPGVRLEERIMRPALNIRGLSSGNVGATAQNAVPVAATASIDFRLVPDQSPARVRDLVERSLRGLGYEIVHGDLSAAERKQAPRFIRMDWEGGYPAYRESMERPFPQALIKTIDAATGGKLIKMPTIGGSIPMEMFARVLGVPIAMFPIANHDNNQHGPNENIRLQNLWDGVEEHAALLAGLGANW